MYRRYNVSISVGRLLTFFLAVSLVFSFGLHSIQIAHTHFSTAAEHGHTHDGGDVSLSEYMHPADKKIFSFILVVFFAPWTSLVSSIISRLKLYRQWERQVMARIRMLQSLWNRMFEYFSLYFRKGILHTKVF